MAHLPSFEFCPVFDKNTAKVRLCVCRGVLVMVTYGHDRFFVMFTSRMDIIHDVTKWAVHLWHINSRVKGTNMGSGLFSVSKKHYLRETIKEHSKRTKKNI